MIGDTLGGRYRLDDRIGSGGMAQVYRARDLRLERDVAVKVLAADLKTDPLYVKRFAQEARLCAKVRHPNLVEVFDVAISDDGQGVYLVMELLSGKSLRSEIGEGLDVARFFRIARGITLGLKSLHEATIVHRDLTPNNVMLVHHGDEAEHVKVLDLGIAKIAGQATMTEPGSFIGTLESMAPEQIRGGPLSPSADVYALGILFFRMLTGKAPFAGEAATLLYHHLEVRPPPVDRGADDLPPALVALVSRCLEKDPSARFADASALHAALVEAEHGSASVPAAARVAPGAVPDLAPRKERASVSTHPSAAPAKAAPAVAQRREAVLEPEEDEGAALPLELEPVERRAPPEPLVHVERCASCGSALHAGSVVCSSCGTRPDAAVTPFRRADLAPRAKIPGWLAPLGTLPTTIGKRVAAYSFLGAILSSIFARGLGMPCALLAVSVVAAAGVYVRSRLDDEP